MVVQEGDSLWAIAQKFGVGVKELATWNGIRNPRRAKIQIGQELVVFPPRGAEDAAPGVPASTPSAAVPGPG